MPSAKTENKPLEPDPGCAGVGNASHAAFFLEPSGRFYGWFQLGLIVGRFEQPVVSRVCKPVRACAKEFRHYDSARKCPIADVG